MEELDLSNNLLLEEPNIPSTCTKFNISNNHCYRSQSMYSQNNIKNILDKQKFKPFSGKGTRMIDVDDNSCETNSDEKSLDDLISSDSNINDFNNFRWGEGPQFNRFNQFNNNQFNNNQFNNNQFNQNNVNSENDPNYIILDKVVTI